MSLSDNKAVHTLSSVNSHCALVGEQARVWCSCVRAYEHIMNRTGVRAQTQFNLLLQRGFGLAKSDFPLSHLHLFEQIPVLKIIENYNI
jgi:hypothetical protein